MCKQRDTSWNQRNHRTTTTKRPETRLRAQQALHGNTSHGRQVHSWGQLLTVRAGVLGSWDTFAFYLCSGLCHRWPFIDWPKCLGPMSSRGSTGTTRCGTQGLLTNHWTFIFPLEIGPREETEADTSTQTSSQAQHPYLPAQPSEDHPGGPSETENIAGGETWMGEKECYPKIGKTGKSRREGVFYK